MQIKEINSKKLFREYLIEIPSEEIEKKIENKIKELAPKTNLPGFRPGKAPINLVKSKYEKDILGEIINNTIQENSKKLLEEKNLKPLRLPKIEITEFNKNTSLKFNIKIDLPPEFDLYDFNNINLNEYKISLTKKDKDKAYDNFINNQSHYHALKSNREIKFGDRVLISINSEDKEIQKNLKNYDKLEIEIGSKFQVLPNIDKLLLEKKVKKNDQVSLDLDFKINAQDDKDIKRKFEITILDIKELHKIKVDESFLKNNNLKSFDELKDKIENNIIKQYELMSLELLKKHLLDSLELKHDFDLPEGILSDENNSIWERVKQAKTNGTLDPDDINLNEQDLRKRYENIAKRRVKLALIVSNIAKKNDLTVSDQEIAEGIKGYSENYPGQEKQVFDYFKKNPSEIEVIRGPLFEKKVIEFVMSKVTKNEKKVDVNEFNKIQSKAFKQ